MTTEELSVMRDMGLYYDKHKPDEDDEVIYNLCEDIRVLKEDVISLRAKVAELEAGSEPVEFTCHGNSAPAYSCNKPGDMSGTYYRTPQPVKVPEPKTYKGCTLAFADGWNACREAMLSAQNN